MKNKKMVLIGVVISLILFALGYLFGINSNSQTNSNVTDIAGTYKTSSWNGKIAVIALQKDKSCVYISNTKCLWDYNNNVFEMTIIEQKYSKSYIGIYLNADVTEIQREEIKKKLLTISELVEAINFEPKKNMFYIEYMTPNAIDDNYNRINNLKEKYPINSIIKQKGELQDVSLEVPITIVDDGLLHEGHFFEKIK